jgi:hypothetical protein
MPVIMAVMMIRFGLAAIGFVMRFSLLAALRAGGATIQSAWFRGTLSTTHAEGGRFIPFLSRCAIGYRCHAIPSAESRKTARNILRAALACAVEKEIISRNPDAIIRLFSRNDRARKKPFLVFTTPHPTRPGWEGSRSRPRPFAHTAPGVVRRSDR